MEPDNYNFFKILLSVGGTVCTALLVALKILWSKVEKLTEMAMESNEKIGRLEGRAEAVKRLHDDVLDIVEKSQQK